MCDVTTTITFEGRTFRLDVEDAKRLRGMTLDYRAQAGGLLVYVPEYKRTIGVGRYLLGLKPHARRVAWFRDGDHTNLTRENLQAISRDEAPARRGARTRGLTRVGVGERMRDLKTNPNAKKSGYHGVTLHSPTGRFQVRFRPPGGKTKSFGYFADVKEAAREYDRVRESYGLEAVNFT